MTELELLELLGDLNPSCIQESRHLRAAKAQARQQHAIQKYMAIAAMLAVLVGLSAVALPYLAANWVHPDTTADSTDATEAVTETVPQITGLSIDVPGILENRVTFYSAEYGDVTLAEYTESMRTWLQSQDCQSSRYAVLDIDSDGIQELVVQFAYLGEAHGSLLIGSKNNRLQGWYFEPRALDCLKADGTFRVTYPSGARWAKLYYDGQRWVNILQEEQQDASSLPDAPWQNMPENTQEVPIRSEREQDTTLSYTVNGEEVQKAAALWSGSRFTMYVLGPENGKGWVHSTVSYGDTQADRWTYADQDLDGFLRTTALQFSTRQDAQQYYETRYPVRLTVAYRPEEALSAVQEWVRQLFPDTELIASSRGSLYAGDDAAGQLEVYFTKAPGGYLVQLREDPLNYDLAKVMGAMAAMGGSLEPITAAFTSSEMRSDLAFFPVWKYENGAYTEQQEPFQLCQKAGWSTYIPNNGQWITEYTALPVPGDYPHQSMLCTANYNVHFTVVDLGAQTLESAIAWAMDSYAEQSPYEGKDGSTVCAGDTTIRFVPYRGGFYALLVTYPASETEGLGVYVNLMCDQFRSE